MTKSTISTSTGSLTWEVQFLEKRGYIPDLKVQNVSLQDSGTIDLKIEVVEVMKGHIQPLSGGFKLNIDGTDSQMLPYDASAEELLLALEGVVFSLKGAQVLDRIKENHKGEIERIVELPALPDKVRKIFPQVGNLCSGNGRVLIDLISSGSNSEVHQVTKLLSGGYFRSDMGNGSSGPIPFDSDSDKFEQMMMSEGFGEIDVEIANNPIGHSVWLITFLNWPGDVPLVNCGQSQTVVEETKGTGTAI